MRQSLSRFLSERRELRTFMTLALSGPWGPQRGAETMRQPPTCQPRKTRAFPGILWRFAAWYGTHLQTADELSGTPRLKPALAKIARLGCLVAAFTVALPIDAVAHRAHHAPPLVIDPRDVAFDRFVTDFRATALAQG